MTETRPSDLDRDRRNLRTGLILGAVALAFALGFFFRVWHYG